MLYMHYSYIEQNCVILELLYELPNTCVLLTFTFNIHIVGLVFRD